MPLYGRRGLRVQFSTRSARYSPLIVETECLQECPVLVCEVLALPPQASQLAMLRRDSLQGEMTDIRASAGVLACDGQHVAFGVHIDRRVFVEIPRLDNPRVSELDVERIRVLEVANFHGLKPRSKKALCTVSPSGSTTTLKYRPPASWIRPQSWTRPSSCTDSRSGASMTRVIHSSMMIARSRRERTALKYLVVFTRSWNRSKEQGALASASVPPVPPRSNPLPWATGMPDRAAQKASPARADGSTP